MNLTLSSPASLLDEYGLATKFWRVIRSVEVPGVAPCDASQSHLLASQGLILTCGQQTIAFWFSLRVLMPSESVLEPETGVTPLTRANVRAFANASKREAAHHRGSARPRPRYFTSVTRATLSGSSTSTRSCGRPRNAGGQGKRACRG